MSNARWRGQTAGAFLRQRNALWQQLRQLEPGDAEAEALLLALAELTGLSREKMLEGLGWPVDLVDESLVERR